MNLFTTDTPMDNRDRLAAYRESVGTLDAVAYIEWSNPDLALNRIAAEPARKWPWEKKNEA